MTRIKKLAAASFIGIAVSYISKPDRGGAGRCATIFAMPELNRIQLSHKPFLAWQPFESPKFRFEIAPSEFPKLDAALKAAGYSGWKEGGVDYGSLSHGHTQEEDHVANGLTRGGHHYHWSYSAKENIIYAIRFP